MDSILNDSFNVLLTRKGLEKMRTDANRIAIDMGITGERIDAFRHAYTSAKVKELHGDEMATALGWANELINSSNKPADENMDVVNNKEGRLIHDEVVNEVQQMPGYDQAPDSEKAEIKERLLRQRVLEATQNGRLIPSFNEPGDAQANQSKYNQEYNGTGEASDSPSILDYFGSLASSIGKDLKATSEEESGEDWRNSWLARVFGR